MLGGCPDGIFPLKGAVEKICKPCKIARRDGHLPIQFGPGPRRALRDETFLSR